MYYLLYSLKKMSFNKHNNFNLHGLSQVIYKIQIKQLNMSTNIYKKKICYTQFSNQNTYI